LKMNFMTAIKGHIPAIQTYCKRDQHTLHTSLISHGIGMELDPI
jgi:hypothetical protein